MVLGERGRCVVAYATILVTGRSIPGTRARLAAVAQSEVTRSKPDASAHLHEFRDCAGKWIFTIVVTGHVPQLELRIAGPITGPR